MLFIDFAALEAMAAGNSPEDVLADQPHSRGAHGANRFSKYLRFAQRHRRERTAQVGSDANNGSTESVRAAPVDPEFERSTGWRPRVRTGSHP